MRRHLGSVVLACALFILQTSGGSSGLLGVHADLVLLFVLATGMRRGETAGALWGVGLGYLADVFSAGLPGVTILTLGLLGFAAGSLREQLDCDNPNTQAIVAALATLVQGAVSVALLEVFSAGRGVLEPLLGTIVPAAAVNGALLPIAIFLRRSLPRWRDRGISASGA